PQARGCGGSLWPSHGLLDDPSKRLTRPSILAAGLRRMLGGFHGQPALIVLSRRWSSDATEGNGEAGVAGPGRRVPRVGIDLPRDPGGRADHPPVPDGWEPVPDRGWAAVRLVDPPGRRPGRSPGVAAVAGLRAGRDPARGLRDR